MATPCSCLTVCAALVLGACTPSFAGPWHQVDGPYFRVISRASESDARATHHDLDQFLHVFSTVAWKERNPPRHKITAVLFDDRRELREFLGARVNGTFFRRAPIAPMLVAYRGREDPSSETLKHELAHYLQSTSTTNQPSWFIEGLASYLQTASMNDAGEALIGIPPAGHRYFAHVYGVLDAEDLFDPRQDIHDPAFYPSAWLLTHYLMQERSAALVDFYRALGMGRTHQAAWRASFADLTPSAIDDTLGRYLRDRGYANYRAIPVEPHTEPATQYTQLNAADAHALRALLYALHGNRAVDLVQARASAADALDAVRRLDENHPLGTLVALEMLPPPPNALERARAFATTHPEDPHAWHTLLRWLHRSHADAQRIDAAARAGLEHHPQDVSLLVFAADAALHLGDNKRAHALAGAAMDRRNTDADVVLMFGRTLLAVGKCDDGMKLIYMALPRIGLRTEVAPPDLSEARRTCEASQPRQDADLAETPLPDQNR